MAFRDIFRRARKEQEKTLREISNKVGLSISYLSDIEHGRRRPPSDDIIERIEDFLHVGNDSLRKAAFKERLHGISNDATTLFMKRPESNLALLRASESMTEDELNVLIQKLQESKEGSE